MFNTTDSPDNPGEAILSRGYMTQLSDQHVDFITNISPTRMMTLIKESEPQFIEIIISLFQKMYPVRDTQQIIDGLLQGAGSVGAFHAAMQKAFVDGSIIAYLIDHLSQKKVHNGKQTVDDILSKVRTRMNEMNTAENPDNPDAKRLNNLYDENSDTPADP